MLCFVILTISLYDVSAQSVDTNQNPPGMDWQQINTPNFQIIYPKAFEVEAQRVANTLQKLVPEVSQSLNKFPRKISIILQNQGVISNGFVTLAPRRSEFFTTPAQEFDSQDWLNSLAVHELRHIVQFDKLGGKFAEYPLLETLIGAIYNLQVPSWFWEGDAVGIETALTTTGRGRLPSFELAFRANTLSGIRYSYVKNYLGSLKDITPGYYPLGYFMTTKLRRDFGPGVLDRIMTRVKNNPFRFYSLNSSVKKYTSWNINTLHDSTLVELQRLWQQQSAQTNSIDYTAINKRVDSVPADYLLPVAISDSTILVLKTSRNYPPAFVLINSDGQEESVLNIGTQGLANFNYNSGKLVWDEQRPDIRFQKRSYNVINIYDFKTKRYRQLTHRTRLFGPALSPDGKRIVAVRVLASNTINLVELDAENGRIIKIYDNSYQGNLQTPQFNNEGNKIVCTIINKVGVGLLEFDCLTGFSIPLITPQKQQIAHPTYANKKVLFKAHYNGLDNIYRIDPKSNKIEQLGSAKYGAFNPSYDSVGKRVLFNNYQIKGLDIAAIPYTNDVGGTPIKQLKNTFINYAQPLVLQEGSKDVFESIPTKEYTTQPYNESNHSYYFNNVQPVVSNWNQIQTSTIGFKLLSSNKMNTLDISMGYQFNQQLKANEYTIGLTYKRLFPIFTLSYTNLRKLSYDQTTNVPLAYQPFTWREHYFNTQVIFPFQLNRRNWNYSFNLTLATSVTDRYGISPMPPMFSAQLMFPMEYQLSFNRATKMASMDLASKWGQGFKIVYKNFPFNDRQDGHLLSLQTVFLTPGFKPNHSFRVNFNYQITAGEYQATIDIPMISGYASLVPTSYFNNTLLLSYQFPVAYPDWEIGPLAYIKRLRGGFFSDFENITHPKSLVPRSYGIILGADINLLRYDFLTSNFISRLIFTPEKPLTNPIVEFGLNINF